MTAVLKSVQLKDAADPVADHVRAIIEHLGEDATRGGLAATPARYAKALRYLAGGYSGDLESCIGSGLFPAEGESPVLMRDVQFYSLCEHHGMPFYGRAYVAYVAHDQIIGISKLTRLVRVLTRRFGVQERMTHQIADELMRLMNAHGVAVYLEAHHLCTQMRGVREDNAMTRTTAYRGTYEKDAALRSEFFDISGVRRGDR